MRSDEIDSNDNDLDPEISIKKRRTVKRNEKRPITKVIHLNHPGPSQ